MPLAPMRNLFAVWLLLAVGTVPAAEGPDFQREVRPILSEFCFRCHGFDEQARKADLRLDQFEGATQPAATGVPAIVPSDPENSELLLRVLSDDPQERMPPESTGKRLSAEQVETLRRWIAAGARYTRHWSFEPPVSLPLPAVQQRDWPRNVIDAWVLSRLEREGLTPSPEADPERLLRRVSLDLIGLPPSPEEMQRFLQARAVDPDAAYLAEVDRLLSSPHFGERLAIDWLDAARYADTNGFFTDAQRQAWPWRDWVIQAFNRNLPFDQFTIEQLAGDLLPDPTREQLVATGFHRNSMTNNETDIIDEEYRVEAVADRLDTTATVWLGLTVGCAQCHDHKFDPLSQREYYQLFAYFNNTVENGLVTAQNPPPVLDVPSPELEATLANLQQALQNVTQETQPLQDQFNKDLATWEADAQPQPLSFLSEERFACDFETLPANIQAIGTTLQKERGIHGQAGKFDATQHLEAAVEFDPDASWTISTWLKPSASLACAWSKIEPTDQRRGLEMIWQKGRLQVNLVHRWGADEIALTTRDPVASNEWHHVLVCYDGNRKASGVRVCVDGQLKDVNVLRDTLTGTLQCDEPVRIGRRDAGLGFYGLLDEFRLLQRDLTPEELSDWADAERIHGILVRAADDRTSAERAVLADYFLRRHATAETRAAVVAREDARKRLAAAQAAIPRTLVMKERPEPRQTYVLQRGQYDQPGAEVSPGVPAVLPPLPDDAPRHRLALARWLVLPQHPLTPRVAVNRYWQMCFGEGLVRTPNDFGAQGEPPTHPELLDALAVRFVDSGWDVKALLRLIVTSATYRQSSRPSTDLLSRDPENRLLARGPRFRLPAELIRDQALAVAGLLSRQVGGPSVKPFQPPGLWEEVSYNAEESYVPDQGAGLWRRSLYTYWKRQAPPPALLTFDARTREKCTVQRSRTNTPLQALVLLNDATYIVAARTLALAALQQAGDDAARVQTLFQRVVSRSATSTEQQALLGLLVRQRRAFADDPQAARELIHIEATGEFQVADASELAAWVVVAQTILNLDEVITRR